MVNETQIVTDSSAQRVDLLRSRFGAAVVPLTVVVDGEQFRECVVLSGDWFFGRLNEGAKVSTAAPSPGEILDVYRRAADGGALRILSLHIDGATSGTVNSARLAAEMSPIPVKVVDTRAVGFGLHRCVRAAAEALRAGRDVDGAVAAAKTERSRACNVFVVGQAELLAQGGRMSGGPTFAESAVWSGSGDPPEYAEVAKVEDLHSLTRAFVAFMDEHRAPDAPLIGVGDARSPTAADAIAEKLRSTSEADVVRYELTPSIAAHLGLGAVIASFTIACSHSA